MWFYFGFLLRKSKCNSSNKNCCGYVILFLSIMQTVFYCKIMLSFSVQNHWKNDFFFTIWIALWNAGRICFGLIYQNFSQLFFWWVIYSFPVMCIYEWLIFWNKLSIFLVSSWFNVIVAVHILSSHISKHIFRKFLSALTSNNVLLWTYKLWHSPKFFISNFLPFLFRVCDLDQ